MKFRTTGPSAAVLIASIMLCHAGDVKITLDQAPPAVQQAIKERAGSNKIIRLEKADEDGQIQYEALVEKENGKKIEFAIKADGTLDAVEERVTLDELPDKVADTVKKTIGDGKMEAVEKVTKDGTVTYEAGYKSSKGDKQEAIISSEGKLLKNGADED
jgi:putative PepSY-like beta-lactamase-inhibitor